MYYLLLIEQHLLKKKKGQFVKITVSVHGVHQCHHLYLWLSA